MTIKSTFVFFSLQMKFIQFYDLHIIETNVPEIFYDYWFQLNIVHEKIQSHKKEDVNIFNYKKSYVVKHLKGTFVSEMHSTA